MSEHRHTCVQYSIRQAFLSSLKHKHHLTHRRPVFREPSVSLQDLKCEHTLPLSPPVSRVELHTPSERERGGGERFLSQRTHTRTPGFPCTGVKGPRSVGCQNATLINVDVSLDDVSLLLKNRGEIKRNDEMHLYLLRFGRSALMNVIKRTHAHQQLKIDCLFLATFIPPV